MPLKRIHKRYVSNKQFLNDFNSFYSFSSIHLSFLFHHILRISFFSFLSDRVFQHVIQAGPQLAILPQPPQCWYNRHGSPYFAFLLVLRIKHRALCMLNHHSSRALGKLPAHSQGEHGLIGKSN